MRTFEVKEKNIKVNIFPTFEEASVYAAEVFAGVMKKKPDCILGLATGSTPVLMYRELVKKNKAGEIDFSRVNTYNLDEYYPISPKNEQSFRYFMEDNLFNHVNLPKENIHIEQGDAPDGDKEAVRYEAVLQKVGGVDLQVLGIGSDGHIGFNEPGDAFIYSTHKVKLTEQTIIDNSRFFKSKDEVPTEALTMGIGAIMRAKLCLFLANGKNKAQAVRDMVLEEARPSCQASILQYHPNVVYIVDEDAASLLK